MSYVHYTGLAHLGLRAAHGTSGREEIDQVNLHAAATIVGHVNHFGVWIASLKGGGDIFWTGGKGKKLLNGRKRKCE